MNLHYQQKHYYLNCRLLLKLNCLQKNFLLHFSMINLGLCLFNLIPLPPLDGFHVLNDLVLKGRINLSGKAFRITHLALIVLMFSTDIVSRAVGAAVSFVQGLVLGGYLRIFGL